VKITPAHDFNDYQVWTRHKHKTAVRDLPNGGLINILTVNASIRDNEDDIHNVIPEAYIGLDRYAARKQIVADLEALGLLEKVADHKLVVPGAANGYYQNSQQGTSSLTFRLDDGNQISYQGSAHSAAILNRLSSITPFAVAEYIENELNPILPNTINQIKVSLSPEKISGQYYHYTHGLQKHQGNCQRIAHGHRSKIQIEVDGVRSPKWEKHWAELLRDIYIGTREHTVVAAETGNTRFEYEAEQGMFALELPSKNCYLVDTETTVEFIAEHIATQTAVLTSGKICVKAFEGVGKGAIAYSKGKRHQ